MKPAQNHVTFPNVQHSTFATKKSLHLAALPHRKHTNNIDTHTHKISFTHLDLRIVHIAFSRLK